MGELNHAKSFRDLVVYQKSKAVSHDVFELSKGFPKEETYSLTDQMRRSSRSIGAQITDHWLLITDDSSLILSLITDD